MTVINGLPYFEYPHVLDGFRTFKCAAPGCRKSATMMVELKATLSHLKNKTRCYCNGCGWAIATAEHERLGGHLYEYVVDAAPTGHFLYRKRCDAYGGWRGWQYMVSLPADAILERECPNPYALRDGDGNPLIY